MLPPFSAPLHQFLHLFSRFCTSSFCTSPASCNFCAASLRVSSQQYPHMDAEKLGLSYLSANLDSIGTNFRHGVNFAASGSTIQPADSAILKGHVNPLSLNIQLLYFAQFKERTAELYTEAILVSLWRFNLIHKEGYQEMVSELICWKGPVFVMCQILNGIITASICFVLLHQRLYQM